MWWNAHECNYYLYPCLRFSGNSKPITLQQANASWHSVIQGDMATATWCSSKGDQTLKSLRTFELFLHGQTGVMETSWCAEHIYTYIQHQCVIYYCIVQLCYFIKNQRFLFQNILQTKAYSQNIWNVEKRKVCLTVAGNTLFWVCLVWVKS